MIDENFLICLVGLPASGKSTFAQKMKEYLGKKLKSLKITVIDPDLIRNQLISESFNHTKEPIVRRSNLEEVKKALNNGYITISDDLNYYSSMRHDLKEIAEELSLRFFIIYISTPLESCLKWNETRGNPIPNDVIYKIHSKFDNFNRYNWDHPFAEYDFSQIQDIDDAVIKLIEKIENELRMTKIIGKKKIPSNKNAENLDNITRKIVGEILKNPNQQIFKNKIFEFRKKFIRENLKSNLNEPEISNSFKKYLENKLNTKIF